MEAEFTGPVYVVKDNIDTDQIIPAQYLNLIPTIPDEYEKLGSYALCGLPDSLYATRFVEEGQQDTKYPIVIAGRNFGCGSSREHAPIAMGAADCKVVIAESFARIFFRNCVATGELYPVDCCDRLCDVLKTGEVVTVNLDQSTLKVHATGKVYKLKPLGEAKPVIDAGGLFDFARQSGMIPAQSAQGDHRLKSALITFLSLLAAVISANAAGRIEINGTFDGSDLITISQANAHWNHLSGDLNASAVQINGVQWNPSVIYDLPNSGATKFLTNNVNFAAARLTILEGRDTVVLNRTRESVTLSIADTPLGAGSYHFIIDFPDIPTLTVDADVDGSDELHVSFAGARWMHKHWSWPTGVWLNGVGWSPASQAYLTNAGPTVFLAEPVRFANAVLVESSARDVMTMRASEEGIVLNFADNYGGGDRYHAVIAFPPDETANNATIAVTPSGEILVGEAAGLNILTAAGVWYELEVTLNLQPPNWQSTGSFIRGNGSVMTLFDPAQPEGTRFYRIVSRTRPN